MKIVINLPDDEAYREVEVEEENIRAAYRQIVREIENTCCSHQIRYESIDIVFSEG